MAARIIPRRAFNASLLAIDYGGPKPLANSRKRPVNAVLGSSLQALSIQRLKFAIMGTGAP
jgi:hypothetical protein